MNSSAFCGFVMCMYTNLKSLYFWFMMSSNISNYQYLDLWPFVLLMHAFQGWKGSSLIVMLINLLFWDFLCVSIYICLYTPTSDNFKRMHERIVLAFLCCFVFAFLREEPLHFLLCSFSMLFCNKWAVHRIIFAIVQLASKTNRYNLKC